MKVHRLPGKQGIKSTVIFTTFGPGEAPSGAVPSVNSLTRGEFDKRIRQARKEPAQIYVGPMPLIDTGTSYKELSAKYAAEIAAGRELQRQMFGRKG